MPPSETQTLIITTVKIIGIILDIYIWIIILRAFTSWTPFNPYRVIAFPHRNNTKQRIKQVLLLLYGRLVVFLYRVTEPVFRPVRRIIPRHSLPVDFAPLVVLLIIMVLQYLLFQTAFLILRGL